MLKKLRSVFAELGLGDGLFYVAGEFLRRHAPRARLIRYALIAQPVAARPLLPPTRGRQIEVRLLREPDPVFNEIGLDPAVVRHRYGERAICFAGFQDGVMAGCLWLCLGPYEEDEVRCRFVPTPEGRTSWDFGMYVQPNLRGGMVFARIWDEACAHLRARGILWTLSRIGTVNLASLASHARLGARRVGTATFFRLGDIQLMVSNTRPFFYLSLRPVSKPELRVRAPREAVVR